MLYMSLLLLSHFHTVIMYCLFNLYCSNYPLYMCVTPCPPCRVWDIKTGQVINDLLHHKRAVLSLKFATDTLVTGSDVSGCTKLHFEVLPLAVL